MEIRVGIVISPVIKTWVCVAARLQAVLLISKELTRSVSPLSCDITCVETSQVNKDCLAFLLGLALSKHSGEVFTYEPFLFAKASARLKSWFSRGLIFEGRIL